MAEPVPRDCKRQLQATAEQAEQQELFGKVGGAACLLVSARFQGRA